MYVFACKKNTKIIVKRDILLKNVVAEYDILQINTYFERDILHKHPVAVVSASTVTFRGL